MLLRWITGVYLWTALVLPPFLVDARAAAGLGALLAAGADQAILPVVDAALVGHPVSRRIPCGVAVAGGAAA
jgi:hypothetical protein